MFILYFHCFLKIKLKKCITSKKRQNIIFYHRLNLTSQTWNKDGAYLFDYANQGYKVSNHKITDTSYIIKYRKDIKIINSLFNDKEGDISRDYIGKISIKQNEEYIWNYNNYFLNNKFVKPYDSLDWVVIGSTKFSSNPSKFENSYKLNEGDFIKLGKITFLVRKIKLNSNENIKETKRNNESNSSISIDYSNSNMNINVNNTINEELVIYNRFNNSNYNYINTNNNLLQSKKTKNENTKNDSKNKNNDLTESVNNKLKFLYLKLKNINEKQKFKLFKCRICFCEGSFEGNDPLISPCKCTGSVKYIHLNCFRKWLTSKIITKTSPTNNIYCYTFKTLECEICKTIIPETVEYRGKFLSLLDFKDIEPPYIILQTMYQYGTQNRNYSDFNVIFVMSFKTKDFLVIGRANNSDIRLNDVSVSRNHAMISYLNGNFYIDDIRSKFGTLLLIQNNILFLPFKQINIQTGRSLLIFRLTRTFLGCFKCFKNKLYEKMSYEENFNINDKKVYLKILESFNYNIVDPVEKFSNISKSSIDSEKEKEKDNSIEENKEKEINETKDKYNEDEQIEKINNIQENIINENLNLRYMFENSIHSKDMKYEIENNNSNIKEENNINELDNISIDQKPTFKTNINNNKKESDTNLKLSGNILMKKLSISFMNENNKTVNNNNNNRKQNESNDILIHDIKNSYSRNLNSVRKNKNNFSVLGIMNVFRRKSLNKKPTSVINIPYNNNINNSLSNNKKINDIAIANTQRQINNISKKILGINKKLE